MPLRYAAVLLLALAASGPAAGQAADDRHTLALRGVPLAEALGRLVETTGISLLYGPELDRAAPVYCAAQDRPAEWLLRCIVESAGKDFYRLSSGTYVVISPSETPPRLGGIAGAVVCAETGAPLPYASVLLADASGGTAANGAGLFALSGLLPGRHRVVVGFVGYDARTADIDVPPDGTARQRIALRPAPFAFAPVVVDGLQRLPSADLGRVDAEPQAEPRQRTRTALGLTVRPLTHSLHIQGGDAGEHQFRLDGAPVFEPVSVRRLFGAFSPLAVDRVAVHKAGYGAAQGSFTAGVVDLDHHLGVREAVTLTADPHALGARLGGTLPVAGRDVTVMAAGRYGLWDLWRAPALDGLLRQWNDVDPVLMAEATGDGRHGLVYAPHRQGSDLGFADLHAAARVQLSPFRQLQASAFHTDSRIGTELFTVAAGPDGFERAALTRDAYRWTNTTGQVRYGALLGARALASGHLRVSRHDAHQAYAMTARDAPVSDPAQAERDLAAALDALVPPGHGNGNRVTEVAAEARLDLSRGPEHVLELGAEAAWNEHRLDLDGPFYRALRSESAATRLAAFAQDRRPLGAGLTLETGLRLTAVPARQTVYAEPRLALRYDAAPAGAGPLALRVAGGLYHQFLNQFDLTAVGPSALVPSVRFWIPVDPALAPPRALHAAAEALWSPTPGWDLRAEGYYKHLPRLLALDYAALLDHAAGPHDVAQEAFIAPSRGYAYGAGARAEHAGERLRLRLGYDWGVSQRTFPSRFDGALQPTPWSEPHRASAAADLALPAGFGVRGQARGVWGRTWRFRQAYYDVLAAHGSPLAATVGLPDDAVLPALYELDLGATFARRWAGTRVELTADVLNVLDRGNVLDYGLRPEGEGFALHPRRLLGRHAVLTLRLAR